MNTLLSVFKKKLPVLFFVIFCNCFSQVSFAQDIEKIGKNKPLKVTGGISTNQIFYGVSGIENRRDPYNYFVSGNLNFDLYGWSVPLSFSLSNQQVSFQQPFNQYGLHPTYKWITAHIGWNSMTFSPYTLNGHLYNGVGVELTPKDWFSFSAVYGRFQKAVEYDTTETNNLPAYKRMGWGFKASFKKEKDLLDLILFKANEDENSINSIPDSLNITPQENLVLSVHAAKSFFKSLVLDVELAGTGITRDTRVKEETDAEKKTVFHYTGGLYTPNQSSAFYKAFKSSLTYQHKLFSVGGTYERIEPEYRTLGSYFFNNDLENITGNFSTRFYKQKINLSVNAGTQRNDILNQKTSQMRRLVGSVNLGVAASKKLNLSASYSNFQTFTNIRSNFQYINQLTPYENLDTLNYRQISQNANVNMNYILSSSKERSQNVNLNLTYQTSADEQGGVAQNTGAQFYNLNAAYSYNITPHNLSITTSFNMNKNETQGQNSSTLGPTIGVNKSFFDKKLKTTFSTSLNNSYINGLLSNSILNFRLSNSYTLAKKHNFNLSAVVLNRNNPQTENGAKAFTEYTGTLGYSYSF